MGSELLGTSHKDMCDSCGCVDIRYMQRCSQRPVFIFSSKISYLIYLKNKYWSCDFRTKFRGSRVIQDNLITYPKWAAGRKINVTFRLLPAVLKTQAL